MTYIAFMQRRINLDATSWRCIEVSATLYKRHVPAVMVALVPGLQLFSGHQSVSETIHFIPFKPSVP